MIQKYLQRLCKIERLNLFFHINLFSVSCSVPLLERWAQPHRENCLERRVHSFYFDVQFIQHNKVFHIKMSFQSNFNLLNCKRTKNVVENHFRFQNDVALSTFRLTIVSTLLQKHYCFVFFSVSRCERKLSIKSPTKTLFIATFTYFQSIIPRFIEQGT